MAALYIMEYVWHPFLKRYKRDDRPSAKDDLRNPKTDNNQDEPI